MSALLDLNYEEVSPDRNVDNGNWSNGLQNFRFSVSNSGGGTWIPSMSYFVLEYSFGHMNLGGDKYTATESLLQSKKITLANDWVSSMYSGASFRVAGVDINNINNSLPQVSAFRNRMKRTSGEIDFLSGDLSQWEPDFSKRLSKHSLDGVYHRDGLIDASPYLSSASGPYNIQNNMLVLSCSGAPLAKTNLGASTLYSYVGAGMQAQGAPPAGGNAWAWAYANLDGTGDIAFNGGAGIIIKSIKYTFPATSATGVSNVIIDGTLIRVGNHIKLDCPGGRGQVNAWTSLTNSDFIVSSVVTVGDATSVILNINGSNFTNGFLSVLYTADLPNVFTLFNVISDSSYVQADPRSNYVNNMVIWQPPLSVFDSSTPNFVGDMQIILTPNSNWRTSAIESAVGDYNNDIAHGVDYAFGIKSLRFYIARTRITADIDREVTMTMKDFIVTNKQMSQQSGSFDFTVPPSTQAICVFLQDSAAGTMTKLPFSRFKSRQYSAGGSLEHLNLYGPWCRTFDERLLSIMTTMCGITKPQTLIQTTTTPALLNNTMLQRYLMTNSMSNRYDTETYFDYLSNGPYYYFSYERDAENLGTYLNVKLAYTGGAPTQGSLANDVPANLNVFVIAVYDRDIALSYSEFGSIVAVQTSMQ